MYIYHSPPKQTPCNALVFSELNHFTVAKMRRIMRSEKKLIKWMIELTDFLL